jgi:hypothetical protein
MNPLVGIYKGRRVHLGDLLQMSRSKSMRRNRHALAAVAACVAASDAAAMPRRTVPRALGGWRGSTLAGYVLRGDDVTYKEKLRMDSGTFSKLVGLFRGSRLDTSLPLTTQRACEIRGTTGRRRRGRRVQYLSLLRWQGPHALGIRLHYVTRLQRACTLSRTAVPSRRLQTCAPSLRAPSADGSRPSASIPCASSSLCTCLLSLSAQRSVQLSRVSLRLAAESRT